MKNLKKSNYEVFEFKGGYFGICEKNSFGKGCIFGGDSACEDHYNKDYIIEIFKKWENL